MHQCFKQFNTRIIIALDCEDKAHCFSVMNECHDLIDVIKINYPLIFKEGLSIITKLKEKYQKPILADFKIADAPVTNNRIAKLAKNAGADAIMVHAIIGTDAIYEIKYETNNELGIFIVTELTHPGGLEFTRKYSLDAAKLCLTMDCCGIQAPGTRPEQIRKLRNIVGNEKIIIACGIGAQGGDFDEVIKAGADYAIIGRAIYSSINPRDVILKMINKRAITAPETNSYCLPPVVGLNNPYKPLSIIRGGPLPYFL